MRIFMLDSSLPLTCAGAMCHDEDEDDEARRDEATRDVYLVCGRQIFLSFALSRFFLFTQKQQEKLGKNNRNVF